MQEKEMKARAKQEVRQNGEPTKPGKQFVPAVDIFEDNATVTVLAEIPGVDKNDVEIRLEDGMLTIEGSMGALGREGKPCC